MFDNRFALQRGGVHFLLPIGGKQIAYAYIRKNGCSAFKRAAGLAPTAHVGEMMHLKWNLLARADARIFVWRDPVDRLVSLYRNKIVDGRNNGDFLRTYRERMDEEPSTFERFVDFAITEADPHCIRQRSHLKPIRYTHAIPLSRLHEAMVGIVGEGAAEPFRRPVNASKPTPVEVSDRALQMIRKHYHADFSMIRRIRTATTASG